MSNNKQTMKKLILLLMLLVSLATANAKCDWSKLNTSYTYYGRFYKFEMSSYDTCLTYTNYIHRKGQTQKDTHNYNRVWSHTFKDTGLWYVYTAIYNKCTKCDTQFWLRLYVTDTTECTWASVNIEQMSSGNYFLWRITGDAFKDTCVKYDYDIIDLSTHKVLTNLNKSQRLFPRIYLPHKGKYRFNLKLTNTCTGCDTIIYDYVDYHYYNHCFLNYKMLSTYDSSCIDSIAGEMTKGTFEPPSFCWVYRTMLLHSGNLDRFTDSQWANDFTIFDNGLSYSSKDIVYEKRDTLDAGRKVNHKFRKPGRYLLVLTWSHYCHGDDTNILIRFTIDPCVTLGTLEIKKPEPKLIGIYDMMGRPVQYIRKDELMIYLYDDGTKKKIIQL